MILTSTMQSTSDQGEYKAFKIVGKKPKRAPARTNRD